jgi:hypothetical protein
MAVLVVSPIAMADYIVTSYIDNNTGYLYRLDKDINFQAPGNIADYILWQSINQRSINQVVINPLNGHVLAAFNNTDKMAKQFNVNTGALMFTVIPAGDYVNNLTYGYDWNQDGVPDLWTVSRTVMFVYSGATTGGPGTATLLASWTVADSVLNTLDGTGGTAILYGPDQNGDGIPEIYVGKGRNGAGGRINVYDVANSTAGTLVKLASYTSSSLDIGEIILGPDVNDDGILDLLVVDSRNGQLDAYNYKTGAFIRVVDEGLPGAKYHPLDIELLPDGSLLMGTRFKTARDPGYGGDAVETKGGNLIRLDRVPGATVAYTPTLLAVSPLAAGVEFRFSGVTCVAPKASAPVPVDGKKIPLETAQVGWTNPDPNAPGGVITCDVWFSENYPKYLPHLDPNTNNLTDPNFWYLENQSFTNYATKVINNQAVTSLNLSTVTTLPLTYGKTYYWRVDVRDTSNPEQGTVIGKVWKFTAYNSAPQVEAGDTVYTWLTGGTVNVTMAPTVSDDGRPNPPAAYTVLWEESPENANLVINSPTVENTTVTITATGTYTLKLTANDTELSTFDTVVLNVYANACAAAQGVPGYVRPTADFDNDCDVDLTDFSTIASQWLESTALPGPLP